MSEKAKEIEELLSQTSKQIENSPEMTGGFRGTELYSNVNGVRIHDGGRGVSSFGKTVVTDGETVISTESTEHPFHQNEDGTVRYGREQTATIRSGEETQSKYHTSVFNQGANQTIKSRITRYDKDNNLAYEHSTDDPKIAEKVATIAAKRIIKSTQEPIIDKAA